MTLYLGLDIATKTGWALYPDNSYRAIRTGTFRAVGPTFEHKADSLATQLGQLIQKHGKPDFCMIERPQHNAQQYKKVVDPDLASDGESGYTLINASTTILLNQLTGAAIGILNGYGVPKDYVAPATWRAHFFPKGWKPEKKGEWKKMAIRYCQILKIEVSNADEAEAVGIVSYTKKSQVFQMLKYEAQKRTVAA